MTGGEMIGFMIVLWLGRVLCLIALWLGRLLYHGVLLLWDKWRASR
jgi:hypothetical protein